MPRQHLTPRKDPVPIVQGAGWASGPVWTGAENLAPPGFDPRTVQPVGSRYTDYATRPIVYISIYIIHCTDYIFCNVLASVTWSSVAYPLIFVLSLNVLRTV